MAGYSFDENGVRRIVQAVRRLENEPRTISAFSPTISSGTPQNWQPGYNSAGATIPAYSVARIETGSVLDGVYHANLAKPSTTFSRSYGLTVGIEIAAAGRLGYLREAGFCTYGDSSVAVGDTVGPKPDSWVLWKNYPGFIVDRVIDSTAKLALVVPEPPPFYLCKADSSISKGSTGTASLYVGASGSETDSTVNITSCSALWGAIATSKWCAVSYVNGVPYISQLEC